MFMRCWVNQRLRCIFNKNAVNQALQCTRKKLLIVWLIRNQWRLRRQTNLNLDSNQRLRISRTNDQMNGHRDERTNELSEFSWHQTSYMRSKISWWYTPILRQRSEASQTLFIAYSYSCDSIDRGSAMSKNAGMVDVWM